MSVDRQSHKIKKKPTTGISDTLLQNLVGLYCLQSYPDEHKENWKPYGLCHTIFCRTRCFRPPYQPQGETDTQEGTHLYLRCQPPTLYQAPPFFHNPEAAEGLAEVVTGSTLSPCGDVHCHESPTCNLFHVIGVRLEQ